MARRPQRPRRGFTLTELMVTVALSTIIAGLALPSFAGALARHRLKSAADALAQDLAEARHDAARRGTPLHLSFTTGTQWCWALATAPGCDCRAAAACQLQAVQAADHPGVRLLQAEDATLMPQAIGHHGSALLQGADGRRLRVMLGPLGRPRVCAPAGAVPGYADC